MLNNQRVWPTNYLGVQLGWFLWMIMAIDVDNDVGDDGDVDDDDDDNDGDGDDDDDDEDEDDDCDDEDGCDEDDDDNDDDGGDDGDDGGDDDDDDEGKMMMLMLGRRKMMMLRRKTNPKTGKQTACLHMDTSQKSFLVRNFTGKNARGHLRGHRFVRACAVEMHMETSQKPFSAEIHWEMPDATWTPGHTVWEIKNQGPFPIFGILKFANLIFNWSPLENN